MRSVPLLLCCFLFPACHLSSADSVASSAAIKAADIAFSDLSKKQGMRKAFIQYIDSNGVLLRPGYYPIVGKEALEYLKQAVDSSFTLTWEPQTAIVAESGELGYTYGLYNFTNKDTSFQGTYVSIWRKQADGNWKYVLDSGNPGVGSRNK